MQTLIEEPSAKVFESLTLVTTYLTVTFFSGTKPVKVPSYYEPFSSGQVLLPPMAV